MTNPAWVKAYGPTLARWMSLEGDFGTLELTEEAWNELTDLLRRDWAVRVLDAWQRAEMQSHDAKGICCYEVSLCFDSDGSEAWAVDISGYDLAASETPDGARIEAAQMLWPELPESVRAEIGERP